MLRRARVLTLVLCLVPAAAAAQTDDNLAKQYYKLGEELYNRADYAGALKQFQLAYDNSKRPALLYNIARCHESLGQHERAIEVYNEYLKTKPDNAAIIEARIANLKKLVAERQPSPPPPPPPPGDKQPTEPVAAKPVPPPPVESAPVEQPAPRKPVPWLKVGGWTLVGVGGALLVTSLVLALRASSLTSDINDLWEKSKKGGVDYSDIKDKEDQRSTMRKAAVGTVVAGGVAAIAGGALLYLDYRHKRAERRAWILPSIGPDVAAVTAGVRF